ncbi:MAG: GerMN domain-containing protein [Syntrophomonadaceae bacterium]|jgi:germination protein M
MTRKFVSVLAIIVLGICLLSGGCFPFSDDRNLKSWRDILRIGPDENNNDTPLNLEPIQPQLENEDQKDRIGVRLYFGKPDGYGLVAEERLITKTEGIARQTLQELLKGPDSSNCLNIFPEGTRLLDINIKPDGLCIVDFSPEIKNVTSLHQEKLVVYAIANTLGQFATVDKVSFRIGGEEVPTIAGFVDISETVTPDYDL